MMKVWKIVTVSLVLCSVLLIASCEDPSTSSTNSSSSASLSATSSSSSNPDPPTNSSSAPPVDTSSSSSSTSSSSSGLAPPASSHPEPTGDSSELPVVEETGYFATYGESTFLNFVVPLFIMICVGLGFVCRLRVMNMGRAGLPEFVWNILAYLPFCSCSDVGNGQYNSVSQSDDTISMSNIAALDVDTAPVTTVSVAKGKKGMQLSAPAGQSAADDAGVSGDAAAGAGGDAAVVSTTGVADTAASAAAMTSPFTMEFGDDEEDEGAWKTF